MAKAVTIHTINVTSAQHDLLLRALDLYAGKENIPITEYVACIDLEGVLEDSPSSTFIDVEGIWS